MLWDENKQACVHILCILPGWLHEFAATWHLFAFITMRTQHDSTCLTTIVKAHQLKKTWHSTKMSHSCFQKQCSRRNMCQREHPDLSLEILVDKLRKVAYPSISFISDKLFNKLSSWRGEKQIKLPTSSVSLELWIIIYEWLLFFFGNSYTF